MCDGGDGNERELETRLGAWTLTAKSRLVRLSNPNQNQIETAVERA